MSGVKVRRTVRVSEWRRGRPGREAELGISIARVVVDALAACGRAVLASKGVAAGRRPEFCQTPRIPWPGWVAPRQHAHLEPFIPGETERTVADRLVVRGAREHNLKDVSLDLPRDAMIVFTGLSGSGKSSLAFD